MLNRIKTATITALLLFVSATGVRAQLAPFAGNLLPAFESLKAYASPSSFDTAPPLPAAAQRSVTGLSGERLFQELHKAVVPATEAVAGYRQARAYLFSRADNVTCNGGPGILTFYSQVCVNGTSTSGANYKEHGDQNGDGVAGDFVNVEHIWPQTYFNGELPMVSDLHQLASTFAVPNSRRGSLPLAVVPYAVYSTSSGSRQGKDAFEPADAVKGNAARAMLYFVVRYYDRKIRQGMNYDVFWTSRVPLLLEWHRQDPPDDAERRRNDLVQAFQGNRNPFVDNPELADQIGAAVLAAH